MYLYLINFLIFLLLTCLPIIYYSRYFGLGFFNPISIPFFIFSPVLLVKTFVGPAYILDGGLYNPWFNFALLMTNLSLFFSFFLVFVTIKLIERNSFLRYKMINLIRPYPLRRKRMVFTAALFFILFLVSFTLLTKNFGLFNWIFDPRAGYQLHRVGVGHWYALSLLFLSVSYTLSLLYSKNIISLVFVFSFYMVFVYFLGSKGFILSYAIFFLIILWLRKSKYFKVLLLIIPPVGFGLMLKNLNPNEFADVAKYFDYYANSAMYYKAYFKGEIDLFYGYLWLTDFYQYIPRVIFEDKPFVYGFLHVNEFFFPGAAEATHTPAFGGPIASFADFGVLGVIFSSLFSPSSFFTVVLIYNLYSNINIGDVRLKSNFLYLFLWLLAPSFLVFFGSIYMFFLFFIISYLISFINRVKL